MKKDSSRCWDDAAETWDSLITSERNPHYHYYRTTDLLVVQLLRETGAKRALELGCGTAGCAIHALQTLSDNNNLHITGIDISPRMIEVGWQNVNNAGLDDRITLQVGNAHALSFPDEYFDLVFSRGVVMSYVDQPEQLLHEAHRVLHEKGALGLDVMNKGPEIKDKGISSYMGKIQGLERMKETPELPPEPLTYREFLVEGVYQVSREYLVRPETKLFNELETQFQVLPSHLPGITQRPQHLEEAELISEGKNHLYDAEELREIVSTIGFRDVKIYGEGYATYLLKEEKMRQFVTENRDYFSKAEILLHGKFRLDFAVHLFVSGWKKS